MTCREMKFDRSKEEKSCANSKATTKTFSASLFSAFAPKQNRRPLKAVDFANE
jgi:hypothetical protein